MSEYFDELRHYASPTCLMAGAQTGAVVSVEIFIEQYVILPFGIGLEFLRASVHRTTPRLVPQEDPGQTVGDISRATSKRFISFS